MNGKYIQSISEQEDSQNLISYDTPKIQYILDENGELVEILKDKCKPVEFPIKHKLINAFEVFVRVEGTENYWISNYGRCVNNANRKDKNTFYEHKKGNCHLTIFEADQYKVETSPAELVKKHFLIKNGGTRIWHKDGDENNNWYKNLLYVNNQQYRDLKSCKVKWQDLNIHQEYIEYENKASHNAYSVYNGIRSRCKGKNNGENYHACYDNATMCKEWIDTPKSFVQWYLEHYYQCGKESMAVDKDLFGKGSHIYSPDTCCILPQGLNSLLSNCKKHYFTNKSKTDDILPYGVRYSDKQAKYYSEITLSGTNERIKLGYHDTPEEAFDEYKRMKEADIYLTAAKYKNKIPDYIYERLLTMEIQPY